MGKLEEASKRRAKRNEVRQLVLQAVQVAGLISIAVVAPNVIGVMAKMGIITSHRHPESVKNASRRLVMTRHLEWKGGKVRLTAKGERELRRLTLKEFSRTPPSRWDGKWRVLIFDIPERRKGLRWRLRSMLTQIGFTRLQQSVWVYPYDCEDLIALLKADFHVGDDVLYMIVDTIERDAKVRQHFGLK